MSNFALVFKTLGVLYAIAGLILFVLASGEEVQKHLVFKNRTPLAGDTQKVLLFLIAASMIACGVFVFVKPIFAVGAVWLSLLLNLLIGLVDLIATHRLGPFCKGCTAWLGVWAIAAAVLTMAFLYM